MPSWMKNTPPRQVTTPCWLPSQPISDAVPSAPVKASAAGRTVKAQSYLLAGPLPVVGSGGSDAGAPAAGGSGANPANEPTATTRVTAAAAFKLPNMAVTLARQLWHAAQPGHHDTAGGDPCTGDRALKLGRK